MKLSFNLQKKPAFFQPGFEEFGLGKFGVREMEEKMIISEHLGGNYL